MPGHVLRPSGSDTWAWCGASYELAEQFPELADSDHAREGTAAHDFVKLALHGNPPKPGTLASNGWPIDAEMVEAGQVYLDYCRGHMAQASPRALIRIETPVIMHKLVHPLNEGTPDFFLADAERKLLVVPDFKYGHREVEVYRRLQLIDYAGGVCEALDLTAEDVADWTVVLAIVQPRCYSAEGGPVREWKITGAELFTWLRWLADRAHAATSPDAPANTGPWCLDCSAQVHCAASQAVAGAALDVSRGSFAAELPTAALGLQLKHVRRALAKLKAMETALEELAKHRLRAGQVVPFFGMKSKQGALAWNDPTEALRLGAALGLDFRKPPMASTVTTPAQALKLGLPEELLPEYATRKSSIELTELDEQTAAKVFSR
jgi:hypothetical protein